MSLELEKIIKTSVKLHGFSGAISIQKRGETLLEQGFGYADYEEKKEIFPTTTFKIASLSKAFTAFTLLKLESQKKLSCKESIAQYFPAQAIQNPLWNSITIEMLINHTSGIVNHTDILSNTSSPILSSYLAPEQLLHIIAKQKLLFTPGTKFYYSNLGYILLSLIVDRVTELSFDSALNTLVFSPLDMEYTRAPISNINSETDAVGYLNNLTPAKNLDPSVLVGAGNMISNLNDMKKWSRAVTNPSFLPPELIKRACSPKPKHIHGKESLFKFYSYGFSHISVEGHPVIYHTGNLDGWRSLLLRLPQDDIEVIILGNRDLSLPPKNNVFPLGVSLVEQLIN